MMMNDDDCFPSHVEKALKNCFPSNDPLDANDFDPVAFINESFPDEASLGLLDPYSSKLKTQAAELDIELLEAIKSQSTQAGNAMDEIKEAREAIALLITKIADIKQNASTSEGMVQEICRDIRKLDNAKRHLTNTITSLKRFHMLVTAVDQLDFMVQSRQYRETGNLLEALSQLFSYFEDHENISSVNRLKAAVSKTRQELKEQIFNDFDALGKISADYDTQTNEENIESNETENSGQQSLFLSGGDDNNPYMYDAPSTHKVSAMYYASDEQTPESLNGACCVIDALGSDTRRKLIEKICAMWLAPYNTMFGPEGEYVGLDYTERRFAWFRRLLRDNDEKYATVFPPEWCMNHHVLVAFIKMTEDHLKQGLRKIDPPESADVSLLVRSLRKSMDFENEMARKYEAHLKSKGDKADDDLGPIEDGFGDLDDTIEPTSVMAIRMKYSKKNKKKANASHNDGVKSKSLEDAEHLPTIRGVLTSVFEPYLVAYVKLESKNMREQLEKVISEETIANDGTLSMLSSGSNLFLYIKNSVKRCTQFTTGQPFYDLYGEFKKILAEYSSILESKLPKPGKKISLEDASTICCVLTSADYCADTIPQLEELIQSKIHSAFAEAITMESVQDLFYANIASSVRALVNGIEAAVEPDLTALVRTNWATFTQVGDQSKYVTTTATILKELIPHISELLSPEYFKNFCDKFAASYFAKISDTMDRCNKVSETGAQQLLLDAQAVKSIFLKVPSMSKHADDMNFTQYNAYVNREMKQVETLLKLVGMGPDVLIDNFKLLWVDGTTEELKLVLNMKGIRNKEQSTILQKAEASGVPKGEPSAKPAYATPKPVPPEQSQANSASNFFNAAASNISKTVQSSTAYMKAQPTTSSLSALGTSIQSSFQKSYNRAVNKGDK